MPSLLRTIQYLPGQVAIMWQEGTAHSILPIQPQCHSLPRSTGPVPHNFPLQFQGYAYLFEPPNPDLWHLLIILLQVTSS